MRNLSSFNKYRMSILGASNIFLSTCYDKGSFSPLEQLGVRKMPLKQNPTQVTKIFESCADEDAEYLHGLEEHLSSLKHMGLIECYNRYVTGPSTEWREKEK